MEQKKSYITFTRELKNYKWFKPLLVFVLTIVFMLIGQVFLSVYYLLAKASQGIGFLETATELQNGYDALDVYSVEGALFSLGGVAIMIPSIWLAALIVKDRPFRTYGSISGGFDIKLFLKFILVALVPIGIPVAVSIFLAADSEGITFSILGFIFCLILTPLQCIAEEYLFRGLIMQTIGGWFRIPLLAVVLQTAIFASQHPYNIYGVMEVAIAGLLLGLMVYVTDGLEASSAAHVVNNLTIFVLNGFGFKTIKTDSDMSSLLQTLIMDGLFLAVVYYLTKKKNFVKRPELVIETETPVAVPVVEQVNGDESNEV